MVLRRLLPFLLQKLILSGYFACCLNFRNLSSKSLPQYHSHSPSFPLHLPTCRQVRTLHFFTTTRIFIKAIWSRCHQGRRRSSKEGEVWPGETTSWGSLVVEIYLLFTGFFIHPRWLFFEMSEKLSVSSCEFLLRNEMLEVTYIYIWIIPNIY